MKKPPRSPLCARGMLAVLVAQFFSALADNAAFVIAIALVRSQGRPTGCRSLPWPAACSLFR